MGWSEKGVGENGMGWGIYSDLRETVRSSGE